MSVDWFRSWHGAPTDPKWRTIAKRAKVPTSLVVACAWALMDRASQAGDRGNVSGVDPETLADFLDCEANDVVRVMTAMAEKCIITAGRFASWEKRQPKREREDDSAQRVQRHRATKSQAVEIDGKIPEMQNGVTASVTPCNAMKHQETPRVEKSREDKKERKKEESSGEASSSPGRVEIQKKIEPEKITKIPETGKTEPLDALCRRIVASINPSEPVMLASDFHELERKAGDGVTRADIEAGIRAAFAKADPAKRFRSWGQFAGWAIGSAKDRMGAGPRPAAAPKPPDNPNDPRIEFPGGVNWPTSSVLAAIERWRTNPTSWPGSALGPPPGDARCLVPPELLNKRHGAAA